MANNVLIKVYYARLADRSRRRARKDDSRPNYKRKKKERSRSEGGKRIRESKYNIHYKNIAKEELPRYLEGRMKWKDRRTLARFRCGNETKAREYWKKEGEKCRLCKSKEENLRHVIEECEITGGSKDIEKTLNETGEGLTELKAIIGKRRAIQDGEERQEESTARRQKPKVSF